MIAGKYIIYDKYLKKNELYEYFNWILDSFLWQIIKNVLNERYVQLTICKNSWIYPFNLFIDF